MRILGIETSCDETAVAIVEDGKHVLSNSTATSQEVFADLGGVIPEDAARRQVECILPTLHTALTEAGCSHEDIDAIAVTKGPGLLGSLLVGATTARLLASLWRVPLIGVHHTLGHLSSTWLQPEDKKHEHAFPLITLSASGGHTDLWYRESHTRGTLLGQTRDDAAGEAFDKGAALLGLPYPGGPSIQKSADIEHERDIPFPNPLAKEDTFDYSFSGLKTALRYALQDCNEEERDEQTPVFAASFQYAICHHLCSRIERAVEAHPDCTGIHLVGGVSANLRLRSLVTERCSSIPVFTPAHIRYCTDNAAMIAAAGYFIVQELGEGAYEPFETVASLPLQSASAPTLAH